MIPFLLQLWMPIVYPLSLVPGKWRWLYTLNPLASIVEGFRAALFGSAFDWTALATASAVVLVMVVYASFSFRRMQTGFADIV